MPSAGTVSIEVYVYIIISFIIFPAPSGPPTSVTVLALSSTSIVITWNNPEEFESNGILTGFVIVLTDAEGKAQTFT